MANELSSMTPSVLITLIDPAEPVFCITSCRALTILAKTSFQYCDREYKILPRVVLVAGISLVQTRASTMFSFESVIEFNIN